MSDLFQELSKIISPIYLVGGAVRDTLMGLEPKDFDFTTPLTPDEVEGAIRAAGRRPYLAGKRFGTVGIKIGGNVVEVTTFRAEQYAPQNRKPAVEFVTSLEQDLARRDFTVNAMAMDEVGNIHDPYAGRQDMEQKLLRAVGNPGHRFSEDPLRLLRAARFAAQLDFSIEESTLAAIVNQSQEILTVSRERWNQELDKLLVSPNPRRGLEILAETRLLNFALPHLAIQVGYDQHSPYHQFTLWEHTLATVQATPADSTLRWTALLHDVAKPYVARKKPHSEQRNYMLHEVMGGLLVTEIGHWLKWSQAQTEEIATMVASHMRSDSPLRPYDDAAH